MCMVTFSQAQGHNVGSKVKKALPCGSETIKVTVTTFGTMVLCGKMLENKDCMVTFIIQGQGHIRGTVTKLGTHVSLMGFALLNRKMYYFLLFAEM